MGSKQCTYCMKTFLLEEFRMIKRTGQYTKKCVKCLDSNKKYREKNKCVHGKQRAHCRDLECRCGGTVYCKHNIWRSNCRDPECGGGGAFCKHGKWRAQCRDPECEGGGAFCNEHGKERSKCQICDPVGHLAACVRTRIYQALKHDKELHSTEYTKCTTEQFRAHIEIQFKEGMSWENYVDHRIPLAYKQDSIQPTLEEVAKSCYYTNTQPLWRAENMSKGNRYIS